MISLEEPPKPATLAFDPLAVPARKAFAVTYDPARKLICEAVVNLEAAEVESWTPVPGRFPAFLSDTLTEVGEIVRKDPRWRDGMRKRGVTDLELCMIDPWPAGYLGPQEHYDNSPTVCRAAHLRAIGAGRARVRAPGRGPDRHLRP